MTTENSTKVIEKDEKIAALAWALIFFLPCFMKKKTDFVVFYMKQAFGLFLVVLALSIVWFILWMILSVFWMICSLLCIIVFIANIFLAYKAYNGEKFEIPHLLKYTNLVISKLKFLEKLFTPKN